MAEPFIKSIILKTQIARITLHGVFDRQGIAADIFSALGQHGFNIEAITNTQRGRKRADISFAAPEQDSERITKVLRSMKERFGARTLSIDRDRALIAVYGAKQFSIGDAAGRIFSKFSELGVNIEMISSTLSALTIVIKKDKAQEIVEVIKKEFL